jgi:hypothetical protein
MLIYNKEAEEVLNLAEARSIRLDTSRSPVIVVEYDSSGMSVGLRVPDPDRRLWNQIVQHVDIK